MLAVSWLGYGALSTSSNSFLQVIPSLYLLLCLLLLVNIILHVQDAVREWSRWQELPPDRGAPIRRAFTLSFTCTPRSLTKRSIDILGDLFPRFYTFHRSHRGSVLYYYFAKKGSASLFGLPWIKAGFLPLLLVLGLNGREQGLISLETSLLVLLAVIALFWLPGLWLHQMVPYQKAWISFQDQGGRLFLEILCLSGSREKSLDSLAERLVSPFRDGCSMATPEELTAGAYREGTCTETDPGPRDQALRQPPGQCSLTQLR